MPTEQLENGFSFHGLGTQISFPRGTVATVDGDGRDVVLVWLFDYRGGYALLVIDAETGETEEFPVPFPPGDDCPYASILSSMNRFYTLFNGYFVEFDVLRREYSFFHETAPRMAMGMTEDDDGLIWSSTYPQSGVVCYNPKNGDFTDYGHVYEQNWRQYPTTLAADDTGWLYFGIGTTLSQIIAFDKECGTGIPLLAEEERVKGSPSVFRDMNGKVYAIPPDDTAWAAENPGDEGWFELYKGERKTVAKHELKEKLFIAGKAFHFHPDFPNGKKLERCDLADRELEVSDPRSGDTHKVSFDYSSEGAHIMGVARAPGDTICGGTFFPRRFFSYNPKDDSWIRRESYAQWNTVVTQGDLFFVGGYGSGFLLEWDPTRDWVPTDKDNPESNPFWHRICTPILHRPHDLLAHPDGKTILMAGTPGYGSTGGGLLIWDRESSTGELLEHTDLLPDHSTMSLVALSGGKLLGGTTTEAGTGGEKKAEVAELYQMDLSTKVIDWREALLQGGQSYTDLCVGESGLVYGFVDRARFFVFDPNEKRVIQEMDSEKAYGLTAFQQGPRVFVVAPRGEIYILFERGIGLLDEGSFEIDLVAESPVEISNGGDVLEGRLYFTSTSGLYSWELP
ncbi:MAG TPA: hypothetical protein DIU35_10265 [Candidatus Latescibacteria bacterium]|nr:hypothetical protein [Candidatus Latescibacterota bacterium]